MKINIKKKKTKTRIIVFGPSTSWQIEGEKVGAVAGSIFLGSKITVDSDWSCKIKRHLFLGRKAMINLGSIFTLLTQVHIVKPMVFPVVSRM